MREERRAYDVLISLLESDLDDGLDELHIASFSDQKTNQSYQSQNSDQGMEKLIHRLEYLKYGFGVRTKITLEDIFPNTKILIGEKNWNSYEKDYSEIGSRKYINLNEIGLGFPTFLKNSQVPTFIYDASRLELLMQDSILNLKESGMSQEDFPKINENDILFLRSDVRFFEGYLNVLSNPWTESMKPMEYILFQLRQESKTSIQILTLQDGLMSTIKAWDRKSIQEMTELFSKEDLIKSLSFLGSYQLIKSRTIKEFSI